MATERLLEEEREKTHNLLVVATTQYPPGLEDEIEGGRSHVIGELELAKRFARNNAGRAKVLDYSARLPGLDRLEERLKLDFAWALKVGAEIRMSNADVILCTSERAGIPLGVLKPLLFPHSRLVVINHHPLAEKKGKIIQHTGVASHSWDMTIVVGQGLKEAFCSKFNVPGNRVVALPVPIDTEFYSPGEDVNKSCPYVYSIGVNQRDYPTLTCAMEELSDVPCRINPTSPWDKVDFHFGDVGGNIDLVSDLTPVTVRQATQNCRFMVLPLDCRRRNLMSGITAVLLAGACGRAVVATDTPAMREYVIDGQTGILVPDHNPQGMAEGIRFLWNNSAVAEEMGQKARRHVVDNFSMDRWLNSMLEIL